MAESCSILFTRVYFTPMWKRDPSKKARYYFSVKAVFRVDIGSSMDDNLVHRWVWVETAPVTQCAAVHYEVFIAGCGSLPVVEMA